MSSGNSRRTATICRIISRPKTFPARPRTSKLYFRLAAPPRSIRRTRYFWRTGLVRNIPAQRMENALNQGFGQQREPGRRLHCPHAFSILAAVFAFENAISVEALHEHSNK
ncbi:hypothetical protein PXNS11_220152 [Stutzerimonas xanthomarina]|nr:hypothetical protein PXNS11_220152 [Stutzerimonas xanthomarina]